MSPPASPRASDRRQAGLIRRLAVLLLAVACAAPLAMNVACPDLWGHVLYGQEWIGSGRLPRTATHTFTAVGQPWVNHELLAERLLAGGFRVGGVVGMQAAKVALGMAMLLLMASAARRHATAPIVTWSVLLTVANALEGFFPIRPQLLSFLYCSLLLWLLDRSVASRDSSASHEAIDWRPLLGVPPLMAVWANSHGGFAFGLLLLAAVLGGRLIESLIQRREGVWWAAAGSAAVLMASVSATLINPYGWRLHAWLGESLAAPRPEITEWDAPTVGNPVFAPFVVLLVLTLVSLLASERRRDWTQVAVLAVVAWQAAEHLRHIALFAILCGFWLPPHTQSAGRRVVRWFAGRRTLRYPWPGAEATPLLRRVAVAGLAGLVALQATIVGERLRELPVYRSHWPVDAVQWMADHRVGGDVLVCFNWAQYAMAALAPDIRVAVDGRFRTCYPQAVIDRHFDFLLADGQPRYRAEGSGPIDRRRTLREDRPDYVLLDRRYPAPVHQMQRLASEPRSAWALLYQDALAQLWGRRPVVDDPASDRYVPPERRFVSDHYSMTAVNWPGAPRRGAAFAGEPTGRVAKNAVSGASADTPNTNG
ncbi:hypothetical protein [Botrimarina sp.]|uniref:hypothetical protein n=1 Tax=Botrimarina sp. TaxID=2795802 RepID=UPI0032EFCBA7